MKGDNEMPLNYEEVPNNILTGKDLDYLSDMFEWNYGAYKKTTNDEKNIVDQDLKMVFDESVQAFDNNLNNILKILESRGPSNE